MRLTIRRQVPPLFQGKLGAPAGCLPWGLRLCRAGEDRVAERQQGISGGCEGRGHTEQQGRCLQGPLRHGFARTCWSRKGPGDDLVQQCPNLAAHQSFWGRGQTPPGTFWGLDLYL